MTTSKTFITNSPNETFCAGEAFGKRLFRGAVVALYGELGAGKTVFTKGIAKALGITDPVTSPTFCLVNVYNATTSAGEDKEKSATTNAGNDNEASFAQSAKRSDEGKKANGGQGAMGDTDGQKTSCEQNATKSATDNATDGEKAHCTQKAMSATDGQNANSEQNATSATGEQKANGGQGVTSAIGDEKKCGARSANSEGPDSAFGDGLDKGCNGNKVGQGDEGEKLGALTDGANPSFEKLPKTLYHVDAYRLSGAGDFYDIGSDDFLYGEGVTVIEWPQVVEAALPKGVIKVHFSLGKGGARTILCEGLDFS